MLYPRYALSRLNLYVLALAVGVAACGKDAAASAAGSGVNKVGDAIPGDANPLVIDGAAQVDFGHVWAGAKLCPEFTLRNTSPGITTIERVFRSCSCANLQLSRSGGEVLRLGDDIRQGETIKVYMPIDSVGLSGPKSVEYTVRTGNGSILSLSARGEVSAPIVVEPALQGFGVCRLGDSVSLNFTVKGVGVGAFTLTHVPQSAGASELGVEVLQRDDQTYEVRVALVPRTAATVYSQIVHLKAEIAGDVARGLGIDCAEPRYAIALKAIVSGRVTGTVYAVPASISGGTIEAGESIGGRFVVRSHDRAKGVLEALTARIVPAIGEVDLERSSVTIEPDGDGGGVAVDVHIEGRGARGTGVIRASVVITAPGVANAEVVVPVFARIIQPGGN